MFAGPLGRSTFTPPKNSFDSPLYGLVSLRRSQGTFILTTKSGGNEFHGMATEVFRNRGLNAVPFFQKSVPGGTPRNFANGLARKPDYKSHDFDANVGGPIR